jgi:hypothetical protein
VTGTRAERLESRRDEIEKFLAQNTTALETT